MKITHLWKEDAGGGGGAIVMHRLHTALRAAGVDSRILCEVKTTSSPHVDRIPMRWGRVERQVRRVASRLGLNDVHRISSSQVVKHPFYTEADVIHLHGLHSGFLSYLALPALTRNKPAVFTLHDVWAMTGHCAVMYDCERWKTGCGKCPYPDAYPPMRRDGSAVEWKLKRWAYHRSRLTVVSPSTRLAEQAKQSSLSHFPIHVIPHGLDTTVYRPHDRAQVRAMLGIAPDRRVLMFVSVDLKQHHKGADLLMDALRQMPAGLRSRTLLMILGRGGEGFEQASGIPTMNLGYVSSDRLKAMCYSAADAFVLPTRGEAFGLVLMEAMACGVPLVSFDVGGVPDLVRTGVTGYLARAHDANDLARGITGVLEDEAGWPALSAGCRRVAEAEYSIDLQTQRHMDLYRSLMPGTAEHS